MEEQTQTAPTLCRTGCGFFGSSATEGMCSKCYRDYQRMKQEKSTAAATAANSSATGQQLSSSTGPTASASVKGAEDTDFSGACVHAMSGGVQATPLSDLTASSQLIPSSQATPPPLKDTPPLEDTLPSAGVKTPKKNRCFLCRKKVGLTGFHCRCGQQFCALHRYADKHNCSFDYKTTGREELQRKHPKVVASKVQKL